jgi:hypothetical protein
MWGAGVVVAEDEDLLWLFAKLVEDDRRVGGQDDGQIVVLCALSHR